MSSRRMSSRNRERREFLSVLGAGLAAAATGLNAAPARAQAGAKVEAKGSGPLRVVDFHNHYVGPAFKSIAGAAAPAAQRARWQAVNRNLSDPQALVSSIDAAGIAARVVNTPFEFIQDPDGEVAPDTSARINDQLAELIGRNPGRLYGLATVDAYSGEAGARELTRAVRELGLRGVFIQGAKNGLFPDAPQVHPTLKVAADLGIPVFLHPISDRQLRGRFGRYRRLGVMINRSTINSAALIALLEGGVFDELPKLRVVVTTLAIGSVLLAGGFGSGSGLRRDAPDLSRRHVYIDTMGLHPVLIRSVVDLLGADHVLAGTDWPIFVEKSVPERLQKAFAFCGLNAAEQEMIASGNTLKLLGVS